MIKVKVFIEKAENGYSAYMEDAVVDYSCMGEGSTVDEAINDFKSAYNEMKEYYREQKKFFEEVEFEFHYDIASFLKEYSKAFSLAGLQRITGINQKQLGHYMNGQSKPTKRTISKIQKGIESFARDLVAVKFL